MWFNNILNIVESTTKINLYYIWNCNVPTENMHTYKFIRYSSVVFGGIT